jgi:hypothetical protein
MIVSLMKMIVITLLVLKAVLKKLTKLLKETKNMHLLKTSTVHNNDNEEDEEVDTVFIASDLCLVSARFETSQGHRVSWLSLLVIFLTVCKQRSLYDL